MKLRSMLDLIKETYAEWSDDNALRLSASLAYYALFSLAPLFIIILSIAGLVFGKDAARGDIATQIQELAGQQAAQAIQNVLQSTATKSTSLLATAIGLVVLLFGASGVFGELKDALNLIWGVSVKPGRPFSTLIRQRFLSFTMVLGIGFLLVVSLVISAVVAAVSKYMSDRILLPTGVWHVADLLTSFGIVTVLFAMIFKILPNVRIGWWDVAIGAVGTAFLFTVGKYLIGLYLGTSSTASYYGAAGSAIIILLWVYYSTCILLFGAEFTKVYARKFGSGIVPDSRAVLSLDVLRARLALLEPKAAPPKGILKT